MWYLRRQLRPPNIIFYVILLLESTIYINASENDVNVEQISGFATGKLNQFKGFYTPRPLPSNAQFTYSSIWASWSAWSFCTNNVQIRVRACNTVRGFSCFGPNRETKPCIDPTPELSEPRHDLTKAGDHDYEAVDPWADDRREALRQLNSDRSLKSKKPLLELPKQKSAGRTFQALSPPQKGSYNTPQGPPLRLPVNEIPQNDGPAKAPSMTPELLFGSKLELVDHPINSTETPQNTDKDSLLSTTTVLLAAASSTRADIVGSTTITPTTIINNNEIVLLTVPTEEPSTTQTKTSNIVTSQPPNDSTIRTTLVETAKLPSLPQSSIEIVNQSDVLHSGEVIFPKEERITLETAKAFEWMLKNMTKAADAENFVSHTGEKGPEVEHLHSGEAVIYNGNTEKALKSGSVSSADQKDGFRHKAFHVKSHPSQNALKIQHLSNLNSFNVDDKRTDGTNIRPKTLEEEFSQEKLEEDLLKIQTAMRQIEGELETLKLAEATANAPSVSVSGSAPDWAPQTAHRRVSQSISRLPALRKEISGSTQSEQSILKTAKVAASTQSSQATTAGLSQISFINSIELASEAKWGEWRPWTDCLCNRQVRTRVCKYDDAFNSQGCKGKSYESRRCIGLPNTCPNEKRRNNDNLRSSSEQSTTPEYYTLAPRNSNARQNGYAFKPNPLYAAIPIDSSR